jgi:hypothetical protein
MWTCHVIACRGTKGIGVVGVKGVVCSELKGGTLECAGLAQKGTGYEWVEGRKWVIEENRVEPPRVRPSERKTVLTPLEEYAVF